MTVDGGHEQRTGVIGGADEIHVGTAVHQRCRRFPSPLPRGQQQGSEPSLAAYQLVIAVRTRQASNVRSCRCRGVGPGATSALRLAALLLLLSVVARQRGQLLE